MRQKCSAIDCDKPAVDYITMHGFDPRGGVVEEIRLYWCADHWNELEEVKRQDQADNQNSQQQWEN